MTVNFTKIR